MINSTIDNYSGKHSRGQAEGLCVAYVSTYPPRECGIATFCQDLVMAIKGCEGAGEPMVVAMEREGPRHCYQRPVGFLVEDRNPVDYEAAARFINDSPAALVCLQHEFGIYGGTQCRCLYAFLRRLERPLVATLHTVIPEPALVLRAMLRELGWRAERLVVMNRFARDILAQDYDISPRKVSIIHHGAPDFSRRDQQEAKARLGLEGKRVLSTFGLVSRGKGIEYVLEALAAIVSRHPEVCYLIIGKTHPGVQGEEKESYREELACRLQRLGLDGHAKFVNRYLTKEEIIDYLAATDIYITPYLNPHQITSGTLAYAVAAGKAIVSTPYLYARFLLEGGRGLLVDFRDRVGLAAALNRLLEEPMLQQSLENLTHAYGRDLIWPAVGQQYLSLFRQVLAQQEPAALPARVPSLATLGLKEGRIHHEPARAGKARIA